MVFISIIIAMAEEVESNTFSEGVKLMLINKKGGPDHESLTHINFCYEYLLVNIYW